MKALKVSALFLVLIFAALLFVSGCSQPAADVPADEPAEDAGEEPTTIVIAAKGWSESMTLGYMAALLIEANTVHSVDTSKINMGPTEMLHPALVAGQIDIYPEYTGTAWMVVLEQEAITDSTEIFEKSRDAYMEQFGITMLDPLGFGNPFAIAMTKERAEELGVSKLSDLADIPGLTFVGDNTTFTRPDVYIGMAETYGFEMEQVVVDTAFFYEALVQGQGDVTTCFGTDGRLKQYGFVVLEDDKNFFPPYDAVYVLRPGLLDEYPSIAEALAPLLGSLDVETMIDLNFLVEVEMQDPEDVAREYLESVGLI
jgi:osmoprotectant transport system substrate-binding protein